MTNRRLKTETRGWSNTRKGSQAKKLGGFCKLKREGNRVSLEASRRSTTLPTP